MVERKSGHENICNEERAKRGLQVVYARKTRERQVFMQELKDFRKVKDKERFRSVVKAVGPKWYQALSVSQRKALDTLELSIYQDLLEARPHRTAGVIRQLGIYPRPTYSELLHSIYKGRKDAKEMLAHLYLSTYGYPIEGKRASYCLNARLILSAILYLGLDQLIQLLKERFAPDTSTTDSTPKRKPKKNPPPKSPYLQKMVAALYDPPRYQRPPPPPLPNLEDLNEPYEEEPIMPKPPPPPPPPPPPKKRLPRSLCDKMAGVMTIYPSTPPVMYHPVKKTFRKARSKLSLGMEGTKKVYGLGLASKRANAVKRKKPVAPSTGQSNTQYTINGVYEVNGRFVYVLGNVTTLPPEGEYIHGGHAVYNDEFINIHCGYRGWAPDTRSEVCDCLNKWHDTVIKYVQDNKCYCGHRYDFGNEGTFPPEEVPFFIKPTRQKPFEIDYQTIFDIDEKRLYIQKEFKRIHDTDSVLHVEELDVDGNPKPAKPDKKKKKKKSSQTCLGEYPKPEDYLKCALRLMRRVNVAARLPDLHLVPELKEWMRYRVYGPLTFEEKKDYLRKSTTYWRMFTTLADKGFGHVNLPRDLLYAGQTTWIHKQSLNNSFKLYTHKHRLKIFRSYAYITNLFWRTMYQAEFPDKKFREIYFSYLYGRIEDLHLLHPYSITETSQRKLFLMKKRYICIPHGVESRE